MQTDNKLIFKGRLNLMSCWFGTALGLISCTGAQNDDVVVTTIDDVIPTAPTSCQSGFDALAQDLIGEKQAFITPTSLLDTATDRSLISYTGTLAYNDRPSHLLIEMQPYGEDLEHCAIRYQLDYQLDIPCVEAREEAFRKWKPAGDVGESTKSYRHQHYPYKTAYLTHITNDTQCLIRVQVNVPDQTTPQ